MPTPHRISTRTARIVLVIFFLAVGSRVAHGQTEAIEYYGLDALGSVRLIVDANGQVIERMDYGPFGENLKAAIKMSFEQYAQLARDAETGQDYAEARNYIVSAGRFNRLDPAQGVPDDPQVWNRYAYAVNRPTVAIDPRGTNPVIPTITLGVICVAVGACAAPAPNPMFTNMDADAMRITDCLDPACLGHFLEPGQSHFRNPLMTSSRDRVEKPPDTSGFTVVAGVEGSAVGITGVDGSTGVMVGASGCPEGGVAAGGFGSGGLSGGVNVSAGAFIGVVNGPVKNVGGTALNVNLTFAGFVNVTIIINDRGRVAGGTVGVGVGAPSPVLASLSAAGTGIAAVGECR